MTTDEKDEPFWRHENGGENDCENEEKGPSGSHRVSEFELEKICAKLQLRKTDLEKT